MNDDANNLHLRPDGSVDMEFYALRARERRQEYDRGLRVRPSVHPKAKRRLKYLVGIFALVVAGDSLRRGSARVRALVTKCWVSLKRLRRR